MSNFWKVVAAIAVVFGVIAFSGVFSTPSQTLPEVAVVSQEDVTDAVSLADCVTVESEQ